MKLHRAPQVLPACADSDDSSSITAALRWCRCLVWRLCFQRCVYGRRSFRFRHFAALTSVVTAAVAAPCSSPFQHSCCVPPPPPPLRAWTPHWGGWCAGAAGCSHRGFQPAQEHPEVLQRDVSPASSEIPLPAIMTPRRCSQVAGHHLKCGMCNSCLSTCQTRTGRHKECSISFCTL